MNIHPLIAAKLTVGTTIFVTEYGATQDITTFTNVGLLGTLTTKYHTWHTYTTKIYTYNTKS